MNIIILKEPEIFQMIVILSSSDVKKKEVQ